MFDKLNAVREKPSEKEKVSKIIFWSIIMLLLGLGLELLRELFNNPLSWKLQSNTLRDVFYSFEYSGLYTAIYFLIFFFIAIKSRTPAHSSILAIMFVIPNYVLFYYNFSSILRSLDPIRIVLFCTRSIIVSCISIILLGVFSYFLWYGKGKGKFADIISVVAVGATFAFMGKPLYDIYASVFLRSAMQNDYGYTSQDYIKIIMSCIVIVLLISEGLIMVFNLRKTAKERKKLLLISFIISIVLGAVFVFYIAKSSPVHIGVQLS